MAGTVLDVFKLLGDLSGDPVFAERTRLRADAILVDPETEKDSRLAKAYEEAELDLLRGLKGTLKQAELRARASALLADIKADYQGFRLLFLPPEPQLMALASALLAAYAYHGRFAFGARVESAMIAKCLKGTPWQDIKASLNEGFVYDILRMRSIAECGEIIGVFFERWHSMTSVVLGEGSSRRVFELAYRDVEKPYGFLPMSKYLLALTPRSTLWPDKVKRLHELESETLIQARGLQSADIDLRRQAEQLQKTVDELTETRQRLESVSKARSEFIDVVSHQFRTPLTSIRWNGELLADALLEKKIPQEFSEAIQTVRGSSLYLTETLDRVFAILDIETGAMVIDAKPAFLWELVQDVYGNMEKDIKRHGLKWKFERSKEQPREVPLDKAKTSTAIKILLGNAIGYGHTGGSITVSLSEEVIDGLEYQVCDIRDDGLGISKEDQASVFEKFFRSKTAVKKVADGTGLGLFIVKNFIEAQGGKVWLKSAGEGKGTTVSFALPIK
jgi:signal transduction histidine kinase